MIDTPHRKSGHRARRAREAKRLVRDRKIFRFLRVHKVQSEGRHRLLREQAEPLSVYTGKQDHPRGHALTVFPVTKQPNGRPMPQWKDLSAWMKVQVAALAMHNWDFLTFNVQLHPDLEARLVGERQDPRTYIRDRLRKELKKAYHPRAEWYFVIEGVSTRTKAPTFLHLHGGIALYEGTTQEVVKNAVLAATGHNRQGATKVPRALHAKPFRTEQAAYATYLFKYARRHDDRLPERRLTMSSEMTGAARSFWEMITGRPI